jgi:hypothetical protein
MEINKCPGFENCKAPICPLDNSFQSAVWYVNEDICMAHAFRREKWRIAQRKIIRLNAKYPNYPVDGYFALAALKESTIVRRGIKGRNSDTCIQFPQVSSPKTSQGKDFQLV